MAEWRLLQEQINAINEKQKDIADNIRFIDQAFIERVFLSVQAHMECEELICGESSYEQYVYQQLHPDRISEWKEVDDGYHRNLCDNYEATEKGKPLSYCHDILSDPRICCSSKLKLIQRHFPDQYDELLESCLPIIRKAEEDEQKQLCRVVSGAERIRLFDKESVPIKKKLYNTIMADALRVYGFKKRKRNKGLDVFHKRISDDHAIILYFDRLSIEAVKQDMGEDYDGIYSALTLDWYYYVGSANHKVNEKRYVFYPFVRPLALEIYSRYRDNYSLEVSLRAIALLYELMVLPFEKIFIKSRSQST